MDKSFFDDIDMEFEGIETKKEEVKVIAPEELEIANPYKEGPLKEEVGYNPGPLKNESTEIARKIAEENKAKDKVVTEVKPKESATTKKSKGSAKAVTPSNISNDEIKKIQRENNDLRAKLEAIESKEAIVIDAQNTDDRKKVDQLMTEGKFILDTKNRPFLLTEYRDTLTAPGHVIVHRVLCDEITNVSVSRYYKDLENVDVNSREFIKETYWVHHKGYHAIDMITAEQLKYLLENGFVQEKDIKFTYVDRMTSVAYTFRNNEIPTLEDILKEKARLQANWDSAHPKKRGVSELPPSLQVSQIPEEDLEFED